MSERMVREDVKLEREEESSFVKPPKYSGKIPQEVLPLISFNSKEVKGSWEIKNARLPAEFYLKKTIESILKCRTKQCLAYKILLLQPKFIFSGLPIYSELH